jgi:hypothetical protein
MAADRYTVREVRGIGLGAGGFVVLDTQEGREFAPCIWRDEANRTADRLNAEHRAILAEQDEQPSDHPGAWTCKACGFRGFWRGGPHYCTRGVPVLVAANPSLDQGPCTVCGKPWRNHGTCPVYESHNYTPASGVIASDDAQPKGGA